MRASCDNSSDYRPRSLFCRSPLPMPGDYVFTGPQFISNQPFSSVVNNKHSQTLADGTHIVTETELHLFRDSDGRTRRETYVETSGVRQSVPAGILIRDPVAGVTYNLQVQSHVAYANVMPRVPDLPPSSENAPAGRVRLIRLARTGRAATANRRRQILALKSWKG